MNIKLIIFDFDGTIMDTKKTIVVSKQETLRQMGLDVAEEQACADTIGMSAIIGFQKLCPELSDDMIDLCMKKYREIFDETKKTIPPLLFPNMIETLKRLKENGLILGKSEKDRAASWLNKKIAKTTIKKLTDATQYDNQIDVNELVNSEEENDR